MRKKEAHDDGLLRQKEEERLKQEISSPVNPSTLEMERLIYELQVHQTELETQNNELRTTQARLEESRANYADLYDFAPVGYLTFDRSGRILEANLTAARQLRIERSHLLGRLFPLYILVEGRSSFRLHLNRVFDSEEGQRCELRLKTKDGGDFHALLESVFVSDASGNGLCRTSIMDNTDRKHAEEALKKAYEELDKRAQERTEELAKANTALRLELIQHRQMEDALKQSEEKFRNVFQLSPNGMELFDANGRLIDFNQASVDIFGVVEPQQLIGFDLLQDPNFPNEVKTRILAGEVVRYEREFVFDLVRSERLYETTRTGTLVLDMVISPLSRPGSTPHGFLVQIGDVTAKKKMEEELFKLKKLEATGVLAGGMAHDFNNLLSIILGNISVERMDLPPGHPTEILDNAEKAARRAKELTDKFVTYASSGAPMKKTMDLKKLLEDSAELALSGSNIKWRSSFSIDLWPAAVDEGQIRQAIINVIVNAREAMPEGGTVRILAYNTKITTEDKDLFPVMGERSYVKISIQDPGVGVRKNHLEKILDPYFSTKDRGSEKGMGFGLAITHSVFKRHGGHIDVKSERGVGTTVNLYLPASPPTRDAATLQTEEILRQPKRILVLEDEEMMLACVKVMCRRLGHEMEGAGNGEEATRMYLEAYKEGRPFDLVILDVTVNGGMGGKETILILRKIDPYVKAIVSSGYSHDPIMTGYKEYGFDDAMPKPYSIEDLKKVLHRLFEQ